MTKKEAKGTAYAIAAAALRGAVRVYPDQNLRDALEALTGSLERHASQLPPPGKIGAANRQAAVLEALTGCQKLLRPLTPDQRAAVLRGIHAWYSYENRPGSVFTHESPDAE